MDDITVVIPVGPRPSDRAYLAEAIDSVRQQTLCAVAILLVNDGGPNLDAKVISGLDIRVWDAPWRMGVAGAFNAGVGLAKTSKVFMLGADDKLLPMCLERCAAAAERLQRPGYYWVGVEYSDGRPYQMLPCNAAMVMREFWREVGGFPPETGSGAPDAALVSILMVHRPDSLICADETEPLYWYRVHNESDTAKRQPWHGVILQTRDLLTQLWKPTV